MCNPFPFFVVEERIYTRIPPPYCDLFALLVPPPPFRFFLSNIILPFPPLGQISRRAVVRSM